MLDKKLAVLGLGYVGFPLAVEFGKKYPTIGFDVNKTRIEELYRCYDKTGEMSKDEVRASDKLFITSQESYLDDADIFIVTVPTPIDRFNRPDIRALISASRTVGRHIKVGGIVIYESTVYPGCTEEDCIPIIEETSGLIYNKDFFAGYSPERINPGDKEHRVSSIKKVTSGSTPRIAEIVDELYRSIITAGTHKASCIKVAEAAKIIENTQRDINIAFVNELSIIFNKMGIKTGEVLEAAGTKWNFLPFKPGFCGGHCISVDPYYLSHKAEELGYLPQMILSGRRLNDSMAPYVAGQVLKLMVSKCIDIKNSKVLVLGITFKENCPDIRNSKVADVVKELKDFGCDVDVFDPRADFYEVKEEFGVEMKVCMDELGKYDAVVVAVAHDEFLDLDLEVYKNAPCIVYDVKGILKESDGGL